ncbi:MAG TPA: hypothetical protein VMB24_03490 [Dehalococcoidales bacterium]|nr:hypothetical protein [Dehalococcoidales bacterium]
MVARTSDSVLGAAKWSAIALVFSVVPVFVFILVQVQRKKMESIFPEGQNQRRTIYALASVFSAVGYVMMLRFDAPKLLAVSFLAGLLTVIVFMLINLYWKISLHTAFISAGVVVLTVVYGANAAWLFVLLPLIGWSRLALKMHTPWQVIAGAVLAAGIVSGIYWGFGII